MNITHISMCFQESLNRVGQPSMGATIAHAYTYPGLPH